GIVTNPAVKTPATAKAAPVALMAKPVPAAPAQAPAAPAPAPLVKAGPPRGGVRVTGTGAPPTSLSAAAAKSVSSQFRRSTWYRNNQDALAAQARELTRAKAAAQASASKSVGAGNPLTKSNATGKPDMLRLFTGKAASKSAAAATKSNPDRPKPIPRAAMAAEMTKAMSKYEQLLKSRIATGARTNQLK
ncbi:MAG: hypothetical protein ACTSUD_02800, partial [Alphaproteobacteria bacterium]